MYSSSVRPGRLTAALMLPEPTQSGPGIWTGKRGPTDDYLTSKTIPGFPKELKARKWWICWRNRRLVLKHDFSGDVVEVTTTRPFYSNWKMEKAQNQFIDHCHGCFCTLAWFGSEKIQWSWCIGCATCDGFFFRNQNVAVVGEVIRPWKNTTWPIFVKRWLSFIRDELRASKIMQDRALNHSKIYFFGIQLLKKC